jgi:hypothetical protein
LRPVLVALRHSNDFAARRVPAHWSKVGFPDAIRSATRWRTARSKKVADTRALEAAKHLGKLMKVLATRENRVHLSPVNRRVRVPIGERQAAHGSHRSACLCVEQVQLKVVDTR